MDFGKIHGHLDTSSLFGYDDTFMEYLGHEWEASPVNPDDKNLREPGPEIPEVYMSYVNV
jgi:hypothetical protein